jgi:hypothetical protein
MKQKRNITYRISKEQTREFGMLSVLVTAFFAFYLKKDNLTPVIFILSLLTLLFPLVFYPFAFVWFGFSRIMGKVTTTILLGVVFFFIVIPVGLIRKMMKLDGMRIKQFKKSTETVLVNRGHIYADSDLLHIF